MATMLASRPFTNTDRTLLGSVGTSTRDVNEILQSGKYYVTDEIARELVALDSGLNHLKLDTEFQRNSPEWGSKFEPNAMNAEKAAAARAIGNAQNMLFQYKTNMNGGNLSTWQENQAREAHHWAKESLKTVNSELRPYATGAQNRVNLFCDNVGVTDRFTGYRHNLTRGSREPYQNHFNKSLNTSDRMAKSRMPGDFEASYSQRYSGQTLPASRATLKQRLGEPLPTARDPTFQTGGTIKRLHPWNTTIMQNNGPMEKSIQEQCGINMTFPGRTEYMSRYKKPGLDEAVSPFTVNPTPNFMAGHGRPLLEVEFHPSYTEYQTRYEWPDGRKIVKLPWLRK